MTKEEAERQRELYRQLTSRPADEIRALAVKQRSLTAELLRKVRDLPGEVVGRWDAYDDQDKDVGLKLKAGDELEASTTEEDRIARRRQYAQAYLLARLSAEEISKEKGEGSTWITWWTDAAAEVVDAAGKAAEAVGKAAGKALDKVVKTAEDTALYVGGALLLGVVVYAYSRGQRGAQRTETRRPWGWRRS